MQLSKAESQTQSLLKTKAVVEKVIELIGNKEVLSEDEIKEIKFELQPVAIDLKRAEVEIPGIALQQNNPNCLNDFNKSQIKKNEDNYQKVLAKMKNFHYI